jgi:hypothetical protein
MQRLECCYLLLNLTLEKRLSLNNKVIVYVTHNYLIITIITTLLFSFMENFLSHQLYYYISILIIVEYKNMILMYEYNP